jgi:hypothetical protein
MAIAVVVLAGGGSATSATSGAFGGTRGQPWTGSPGVTESVATLDARQRAEDRRRGGRPLPIREKPEPGGPHGPKLPGPAVPQQPQRAAGQVAGPNSALTAGTSFLGAQVSESGFIPPDSMGSVGPSQVLVAVNGRIKVFDKQGNLGALNVTDSNFFASVRNGFDVTDPQVEYDRLSGRWFIAEVNFENSNNRVMLAVSSGPTITNSSSFTFFFFNQNVPPPAGDSGKFADYPQMGVDRNAVYIGANMFGGTFSTSAFVIRKSSVLGAGPIVVSAFRNLAVGSGTGPFSPQPAQDMDPSVNEGYIVGADNQVFSQLDVRRITNPGATPSISGNLTVAVPQTDSPVNNALVPAQGTTGKGLDALDDRLFEAMVARRPSGALSLWTAHNIGVSSSGLAGSGADRDGDRWYELGNLSTSPSLLQSGTLFDSAASSPRFFWIPSIAANGQGHASLNSSAAGSTHFAEIASSGQLATDSTGTTQPFQITQTSSSSYNLSGGSPPEKRWGDYSQTVVDPTDNMTFWTFQEYPNAQDSWAVRVIKLKPPPPATPAAASPSTVPTGQSSVSVQITGTTSAGSGFFDPGPDTGGPGFPSHISAAVSGGVTVNSVTYTDPTHVTLNLNTTAASSGSQDVTITNPDGQAVTGSNLLVIGSDMTPPDPPTLSGTNPASPANNNSPRVLGAAEGGSTVKLYTDASCTSGPVGTGSAAQFASPGITINSPPVGDNSTTTFYATATDNSNNTSDCSSTLSSGGSVTYVEDSIPPSAPSSLSVTPSSPANNNNPVVSGSADSGTIVTLYNAPTTSDCTAGNVVATGSAAAFNSTGITAPVADNTNTTIRATATDAAGNPSSCSSSSVVYVEDSTPPPPPSSLTSSPASPANDNSPEITGSAEAGSTVKLYKAATTSDCTAGNLVTSGTAAAFASPGLSASVTDDTTTTFRATATDAVGNPSGCSSSSVVYVEDSNPPAAPSSLASLPASPANDNSPEITGSAEVGSTIRVYKANTISDCTVGNLAATGTAAAFLSPGLTVSVADNSTTTFRATATDAAGNPSGCSSSFVDYIEDSNIPAAPVITATNPASPSNSSTTPLVQGTASSDTATVEVFTQANCGGSVQASGSKATFEGAGIQVTVGANQPTQLSARARNASNTASACSNNFPYTHDSLPPAAPTITATDPTSPSNSSTTPKVIGSSSSDTATIQLFTQANCGGSVQASGSKATFEGAGIQVSVTANAPTTLSAKALDAAGNLSGCSNNFPYTHDSVPPNPPTGLASSPISPANENSPEITGGAEAGSTVRVYKANTSSDCTVGNLAATGTAGAFLSPGLTVSLADNSTTTFRATATDAAGNPSGCSSSFVDYIEDSTSPAAFIDDGPSGVTNDPTPTFDFHALDAFPAGDIFTFQCSIDSGAVSFGPCSGPGSSDTPASPLPDGAYTFRVRAIDQAGNISAPATATFTVQTPAVLDQIPPETTITGGPKKKTTKRRPRFTFVSSEFGSSFQCQLDAGQFQPCSSPFKPPKLRLGKHKLRVEAIDPAGNVDATPAVKKFKVIAPSS